MLKKIKKKTKKLFVPKEEKLKKSLIILTGIFLFSFLIIFTISIDYFKKLNFDPSPRNPAEIQLESQIRSMVKGYPIEKMAPEIASKDRKVAAFLVSIAKKESNWGKRVPVLEGKDCYNYWGYRGQSDQLGSGGHTCFKNRREAVNTVARRIDELINEYKLDSPQELIVWKCGSSCEGHSQYSVKKWISDVSFYYNKLSK